MHPEIRFETAHGSLGVRRPAPGVVLVTITGRDVGDLGDAPFAELAKDLADDRRPEIFIDARDTLGATADVSGAWAIWLRKHRDHYTRVSFLTGSRFVELTASFVQRFAELGQQMRIYTDPAAFDEDMAAALRN